MQHSTLKNNFYWNIPCWQIILLEHSMLKNIFYWNIPCWKIILLEHIECFNKWFLLEHSMLKIICIGHSMIKIILLENSMLKNNFYWNIPFLKIDFLGTVHKKVIFLELSIIEIIFLEHFMIRSLIYNSSIYHKYHKFLWKHMISFTVLNE